MAKDSLFKEFLNGRVTDMLSDYIKELDFDIKSLGDFLFENLEIREDLLLLNDLPLIIQYGKIGRIKVQFSLLSFKSNPCKIEIDNVEIRIRLLVEQRNLFKKKEADSTSQIKLLDTIENFKKKKLESWEAKIKKYFKTLSPPSWIKQKIDHVIKNMVVKVNNFNLYYEVINQ